MKLLILFAYPALEKSRVHKQLIKGIDQLEQVTFHDLYQAYPHFGIDIQQEQEMLLQNDIIVFQHPVYWYSVPPLIKEWVDLVLEHGWAYGRTGSALQGKYWLHVLSTGAPAEAYLPGKFLNHTLRDFFLPMEYTAKLCKMQYLPPYAIQGTHLITPEALVEHQKNCTNFLLIFHTITGSMKNIKLPLTCSTFLNL